MAVCSCGAALPAPYTPAWHVTTPAHRTLTLAREAWQARHPEGRTA